MASREVLMTLLLRLNEEKLITDKDLKSYQIRIAISNPELYNY
jgi:hypothetical protein